MKKSAGRNKSITEQYQRNLMAVYSSGSSTRDAFLGYCGVYKKYKVEKYGATSFYHAIGNTKIAVPVEFILDEKEGMWSIQCKFPSGYVNKTPWFRFGEPFTNEVGFKKEMFEEIVVAQGSNEMLITMIPEKEGRKKIEIVLEFTKHGQVIAVTQVLRKEGLWFSFLRFCCWGMNDVKKGLEERAYFKKAGSFIIE